MIPLASLVVLFTVALVAVKTVTADFLNRAPSVTYNGFIDPIVAPGTFSSHVHDVFGSSAFSENVTSGLDLRKGTCTGSVFKNDKSAYWFPSVYVKSPKTGNLLRGISWSTQYYLFNRTEQGTTLDQFDFTSMSDGLRVLLMPKVANDPLVKRISFSCSHVQDAAGNVVQLPEVPGNGTLLAAKDCITFVISFEFPSCWNGELSSSDFFSHLTYANQPDNSCPSTHPRTIPLLRLSHRVHLPFPVSWEQDPEFLPFYFANGLPDGGEKNRSLAYGAHADFFSGWEPESFKKLAYGCYHLKPDKQCAIVDPQTKADIGTTEYDYAGAEMCASALRRYTTADTVPFANITAFLRPNFQGVVEPSVCEPLADGGEECWAQVNSTWWSRTKTYDPAQEPELTAKEYPLVKKHRVEYNKVYSAWTNRGTTGPQ